MHFLEAGRISKTYDSKPVVRDVSMSVRSGEIVGLLGPNGAGKTTTFSILIGLIKPDGGTVTLDGAEIGQLPMYKRALEGVGYLPQEPSIFRKLTVRENLRAVLEIRGIPRAEAEARITRIIDEFAMDEFADRQGARLSGGQRRRAEIARCIATTPKFILFDEPFAGIDPIAILELKRMLKYLRDQGLGVVITDHNVRDTLSITDRAYILSDGVILDEGAPEKLVANPRVKDVYLGEEFRL